MTSPQHSPLTQRLYDLEYPRSLGVYSTYAEVQAVVDALADRQFPVQNTMIVGTDLKLIERVTGRRTWGKVIGQGVLSGVWMGLFIGLILMFLNPGGSVAAVVSSVLLGIIFFTVWAVIGYAMTGGKRDFTSMTATIPMQYELMVEHSHAEQARRVLAEAGVNPGPATGRSTVPPAQAPGLGSPSGRAAAPGAGANGFGHGASGQTIGGTGAHGASGPGGAPTRPESPAGSYGYGAPSSPAGTGASHRPSYGQPAPTTPEAQRGAAAPRPSYGRPAEQATTPATGSPSAAESPSTASGPDDATRPAPTERADAPRWGEDDRRDG
ncbi:hypothetical protein NLU66_07690 [Brachybacterium sp. NBEC-018]|uniref:general stress protein n=1 Tax=Brachybacterium sp. NBEC-018 TaxID=2996004 RepID=UPI00217507F6|nr:general stress protein [Brachybacterium sp. NBEC-018]UVY85459.1 hypothetical protein NLU66_07690 [Brachybacterium sp. NBEC-018]